MEGLSTVKDGLEQDSLVLALLIFCVRQIFVVWVWVGVYWGCSTHVRCIPRRCRRYQQEHPPTQVVTTKDVFRHCQMANRGQDCPQLSTVTEGTILQICINIDQFCLFFNFLSITTVVYTVLILASLAQHHVQWIHPQLHVSQLTLFIILEYSIL